MPTGVMAFDPDKGGVVSAGGVGFDIACGVRTVTTGLTVEEVEPVKRTLAELLARKIPAGLGSRGKLHVNKKQMDEVLAGGARWAVDRGYGTKQDLQRIEEEGAVTGADPAQVSDQAKKRQEDEVGTLGSGNHYLEVQQVTEIYEPHIAEYSLWLAGPRSSNSYRVSQEDGDGSGQLWNRASGKRPGLCANQQPGRQAVRWSHEVRNQLRFGQPANSDSSIERGVRRRLP
jgi:hypothetical protein